MFRIIYLFAFLLFTFHSYSQNDEKANPFDIGFEAQAYPTGFLLGTRFEKAISKRDAIHLRIGYNFVNHRDWGVHDDERGGGAGLTLGYNHYFKDHIQGFSLGVRNDVWFNSIDWKDDTDMGEVSGTSEIIVVQPTLIGGYQFLLKNNYWVISPTIAFGYEINVKTDGADVGEGPILLIGINASYRFW